MKKGFYTIMSAQFFSSLADNALFVAAVELIRLSGGAEWQRAALVPMFALFYVVLAPFVGAFADAVPKGRVMFFSNLIKVLGCVMMLFGTHPLAAYAVVGLGAAAYSPAKYGILTELLPNSQLVKANGWIEGLTIGSIILGVLLGGQLVGQTVSRALLEFDMPMLQTGVDTAPEAAIASLMVLYVIAALFNLYIPAHRGAAAAARPRRARPGARLLQLQCAPVARQAGPDLARHHDAVLGRLGQPALHRAGLGAAALGYGTTQASSLVGVVALGTAFGAVIASMRMRLDQATRVIPLGIVMGVLVIGMNFITNVWVAAPFLIVLGAIGGFLVVPMNALLQHRGHNLMGAGRSIAVQNFNEQACILGLGAFYTGMTRLGLSAFGAITIFGIVVAFTMALIQRWHAHNGVKHKQVLDRLLALARSDRH